MRFHTVVLAAICLSGSAFGFDLKGVELGKFASHEQLRGALGVVCIGKCGPGRVIIAGVECTTAVAFDDEKKVDEIVAVFGLQNFEVINTALMHKYGLPTKTLTTPIITAGGNHLTGVTNVWSDNAGNVLSIENYSDATHGRLMLATQARIELMASR